MGDVYLELESLADAQERIRVHFQALVKHAAILDPATTQPPSKGIEGLSSRSESDRLDVSFAGQRVRFRLTFGFSRERPSGVVICEQHSPPLLEWREVARFMYDRSGFLLGSEGLDGLPPIDDDNRPKVDDWNVAPHIVAVVLRQCLGRPA